MTSVNKHATTNCSAGKYFDLDKVKGKGNDRTTSENNAKFFSSNSRFNSLTKEQKKRVTDAERLQRPVPINGPKENVTCNNVTMKLLSQKKTEKWLRNLPIDNHVSHFGLLLRVASYF